jgi:hypothetical protein
MAQKQTLIGTSANYLQQKFLQAVALAAGRARISIYTQAGVSATTDGTIQTIFSKTFKAGFFKSVGDSIEITVHGNVNIPVGKTGSFQIRISEDSAVIDPVDYIIRVPFTAGAASVDFMGSARLILQDGNLIQGNGITFSDNLAATVNNRRLPGPYTYNTDKLGITGLFIGDSTCTVTIDLFQVEFIPAVIT